MAPAMLTQKAPTEMLKAKSHPLANTSKAERRQSVEIPYGEVTERSRGDSQLTSWPQGTVALKTASSLALQHGVTGVTF